MEENQIRPVVDLGRGPMTRDHQFQGRATSFVQTSCKIPSASLYISGPRPLGVFWSVQHCQPPTSGEVENRLRNAYWSYVEDIRTEESNSPYDKSERNISKKFWSYMESLRRDSNSIATP